MGTGAVQHIVVFRFPRELTEEEERYMYAQVRRWPSEIGGFTKLRLGTDMTKARNRGYQYLLFEEFESEAAMQAYFPHPVHQEFARWVAEQQCETLAFDYLLGDGSVFVPE
jgi:hypothetical protein